MHRLISTGTKPHFVQNLFCIQYRVAKACRLNAEVQHLAVRQHKDLLPGTGDALHIHHDDTVGGKDHLIAHRLVGAHDALAVQKQCTGIFANILFLKAEEVFLRQSVVIE